MTDRNGLKEQMLAYENISRIYLTRREPLIIRVDGKAFHSFTRGFERPFDEILHQSVQETAKSLCEEIDGCRLAYSQSDEINLLLVDYEKFGTQPWFQKNLQKIVSVSASMATMHFNRIFTENVNQACAQYKSGQKEWNVSTQRLNHLFNTYFDRAGKAMFDSRAFLIPKDEVCNYFIYRQQDAVKNSINMVGRLLFSHQQLVNVSCNELQEMMFEEHGLNWNHYPTIYKRGACVIRSADGRGGWKIDKNIPVFSRNRDYIERFVYAADEKRL